MTDPAARFTAISTHLEALLAHNRATEALFDPRTFLVATVGPGYRSGPGWWVSVGGMAPWQGDGLVDDHAFYYRAEEGGWSIRIAEAGRPSAITVGHYAGGAPGWLINGEDHDDPEMGPSDSHIGALARIERAVAAFRAGALPRVEGLRLHDPELELAFVRRAYSADREDAFLAWLNASHPLLTGRTPNGALVDFDYDLVCALARAEAEVRDGIAPVGAAGGDMLVGL